MIEQLLLGNESVFEQVYKEKINPLFAYAMHIVEDAMKAEDIVQNVFIKIWEKKAFAQVHTSLNAYLYKAVHNACLNEIKRTQTAERHKKEMTLSNKQYSERPDQKASFNELEKRYRKILNELPEQCRTVFQMSRFEGLKYKDIAARLLISEKTVENHMVKALKNLRLKLAEFIVLLGGIIVHLKNYWHG